MDRREFLTGTLGAMAVGLPLSGAIPARAAQPATAPPKRFKLKYAPNPGAFENHAGPDLLDQIRFAADQGFTAWEDLGIGGRPTELQEKVARELARRDMTIGAVLAYADFGAATFVYDDPQVRAMLLERIRAAVEVARRVNANKLCVVPGQLDPRMDIGYQTANVIEHLKACAEVCEQAGMVMVLEPLNPRDHPQMFLTRMSQAYQICRAVNSPACKILMDVYHQQITEGNLIPNMQACWSEIAHFHVGDNPGRKEPTTGEINYRNIFKYLYEKGYQGVISMEHGKSRPGREGEQALIAAYRTCDDF